MNIEPSNNECHSCYGLDYSVQFKILSSFIDIDTITLCRECLLLGLKVIEKEWKINREMQC